MRETLSYLTSAYESWQESQGLNLGSADEALIERGVDLTAKQRKWLNAFVLLWELSEESV